jgi:hypothetical protein
MGRNRGYALDESTLSGPYGKFFRGDLDEVIIYDTSLSAAQIQRLMSANKISDR